MRTSAALSLVVLAALSPSGFTHGTVVSPASRVYRVYQSNPENPNFALAANAVSLDGTLSYYTWNEVSRNIPQAVTGGLPPGFDYSPWMPDGQIASAGRVDPLSPEYSLTFAGLDQVSSAWPTTSVQAGEEITVDFLATAPHDPSVWDVWMTTPDWDADSPLTWAQMEFLGRPVVTLEGNHYTFDLTIPTDRTGHHVLWVAWQRDDPVGEVFISTSDIDIQGVAPFEDLGDGLAGTQGVPVLEGDGTLLPADPVSLALSHALAFAPATLVVGFSEVGAPLKGGVLVPSPDMLVTGFVTDGSGSLTLNAAWPTGVPPGFSVWLQQWIVDAGAPQGLAASNGLRATTP